MLEFTKDDHLVQHDFSHQDLTGAKFTNCNLEAASFEGAILNDAVFNHCTGRGITFNHAEMRHVKIDNCDFRNSWFEDTNLFDSQIKTLNVEGSSLMGCRMNKSKIDGLNVAHCYMNMASLLDTQILSISYQPALKTKFMRNIHPLIPGRLHHNNIFINGNHHLEFAAFCRQESIKERLFTNVDCLKPWLRPLGVAALWTFGLVSDFGQSFGRWMLFVSVLILCFALMLVLQQSIPFATAFEESLRTFFGLDLTPSNNLLYLIEAITGYFMLGVLISLLTSKLQLN